MILSYTGSLHVNIAPHPVLWIRTHFFRIRIRIRIHKLFFSDSDSDTDSDSDS
jgi:hypothetical protein